MTISPRLRAFKLKVRLASLRRGHQAVKARISNELKRPVPCSLALQALKRQRLRLKDEMARCGDMLGRAETAALDPSRMA